MAILTTTRPSVPFDRRARRLVLWIADRLERQHRSPRLGNPRSPLADLVFILLSGRTSPEVHRRVYRELRRRYPTWAVMARARRDQIRRILAPAGLATKRASMLTDLLSRIRSERRTVSLDFLRGVDASDAENFLVALPGVGIKTARCVMLYALGHPTFPVDSHVRRILSYFGLVDPRVRLEYAQDDLERLVPSEVRYSLHVNLVAHGRSICLARSPRCDICSVYPKCGAAIRRMAER